jgi:phosphate uptake regulator
VSQLILLVIVFQEQNAAMPPELPPAAAQVEKTAKVLVNVAKDLADEEYQEYPDIRVEIIDAADNVDKASNGLMRAINDLKTAADRKKVLNVSFVLSYNVR